MLEELADGHVLLTPLGELRPGGVDALVVIE
jgi:hypothetical protein